MAWPSIGAVDSRGSSISPRTVNVASWDSANASSVSSSSHASATFEPCAGNNNGASSRTAASCSHDDRQRLVGDVDELGGVERSAACRRHDERNGIADEARDIGGQRQRREWFGEDVDLVQAQTRACLAR